MPHTDSSISVRHMVSVPGGLVANLVTTKVIFYLWLTQKVPSVRRHKSTRVGNGRNAEPFSR